MPDQRCRAARISTVEIAHARLEQARADMRDWQGALDHAFWEAQREGVEIRLLASFTGYSVQAVYQAIDRAKRREEAEHD